MNNKGETMLGVIGMVIFLVIIAAVIVDLVSSCDGTIVRGLFWFECVGGSDE